MKEPARLGEPVTSGVSLGSPGRVSMVPNAFFAINRCEGKLWKRFQGSEGMGIKKREKEEEQRRGNETESLPNCDHDQSLRCFLISCSSCDH